VHGNRDTVSETILSYAVPIRMISNREIYLFR
jgi:hypothetical protein